MSVRFLNLTPHDPLIARDGRPFGAGQGNRMRGLPWPLPSVVAGSFRTALVKATNDLDFSGDMPQRLFQVAVAGVFPVHEQELYLPAPNDAVAEPGDGGKRIKTVHRVSPQSMEGGCDFPDELALKPVMLSKVQAASDFKPAEIPNWWPRRQLAAWLSGESVTFDPTFLDSPRQEHRDHVCLDADRGAAAEGQIFATAGLNVTHLPRFGVEESRLFHERLAEVTLSARIAIPDSETALKLDQQFDIWHPLGGERRLVHWHHNGDEELWACPDTVIQALNGSTRIRMALATPAIFKQGWKPDWLNGQLEGTPPGCNVKLKLVGVSNDRWKAVSGWSLAPPKGPKPIRRMVPAGSVYFFEVAKSGNAAPLADLWLQSVSDDEQERRDGFGMAVWGIW